MFKENNVYFPKFNIVLREKNIKMVLDGNLECVARSWSVKNT